MIQPNSLSFLEEEDKQKALVGQWRNMLLINAAANLNMKHVYWAVMGVDMVVELYKMEATKEVMQ